MPYVDKDDLVAFFAGRQKDLYSAKTVIDIIESSTEQDVEHVVYCCKCIYCDRYKSDVHWCDRLKCFVDSRYYCCFGVSADG